MLLDNSNSTPSAVYARAVSEAFGEIEEICNTYVVGPRMLGMIEVVLQDLIDRVGRDIESRWLDMRLRETQEAHNTMMQALFAGLGMREPVDAVVVPVEYETAENGDE